MMQITVNYGHLAVMNHLTPIQPQSSTIAVDVPHAACVFHYSTLTAWCWLTSSVSVELAAILVVVDWEFQFINLWYWWFDCLKQLLDVVFMNMQTSQCMPDNFCTQCPILYTICMCRLILYYFRLQVHVHHNMYHWTYRRMENGMLTFIDYCSSRLSR